MPRLQGSMDEVVQDSLRRRPGLREKVETNAARWRLGRALYDARRKAGLSQKRLAAITRLDQAQISRMESVTGPHPDDESVRRFLEGCGYVAGYVWGKPSDGGLHVDGAVALGGSAESERLIETLIGRDVVAEGENEG